MTPGSRVITLLGPQRRPTLDQVATSLDPDAQIAVVTAGWQEREGEDDELRSYLGGRGVNLELYRRLLDVAERDPELAAAELAHRELLDELSAVYLVQLDHALRAEYAVAAHEFDRPRTSGAALADALAVVRHVDDQHLLRVDDADAEFYQTWRPQERDVVAHHRAAVRRLLESSTALVLAGGHVGVLLRALHLMNVTPSLPTRIVAWSAGAMALTDRVVLFYDRGKQESAPAEVYGRGLGIVAGAVLLPHARRRLRVDDTARMSALARRFLPARCVVLDDGIRLDLTAEGAVPPDARVVTPDGRIQILETA